MKTRDGTLEAYVERANQIFEGLESAYEATSAFEDIWNMALEELEEIIKKPNGDRHMEFKKYNTRYPYNQLIPGLIAETIAAINLYHQFNHPITKATDRDTQYVKGIDLWINPEHQNHTVQVKAVRLLKNKLDGKNDFSNLTTDWVSLVDIDDYHHFFLERNIFSSLLHNKKQEDITFEDLETTSTYYYNNMKYYGSKLEKLACGLISKNEFKNSL